MRVLVACPSCSRQFDASRLETGSSFHCLCGKVLDVPPPQAHEARVVRCSSCGAPRDQGNNHCSYCNADFTLHEKDLHTMCPGCMARVSDQAEYCHSCGTAIVPTDLAGDPTEHSCPACGLEADLISRSFSGADLSMLECPRCTGIWLENRSFKLVADRARSRSREPALYSPPDGAAGHESVVGRRQEGSLYRPCPVCSKLMHRRNFGLRSGIIIDTCREHGYWFDSRELDGILRWIHRGGEAAAAKRSQELARELARRPTSNSTLFPTEAEVPRSGSLVDLFSWLGSIVLH